MSLKLSLIIIIGEQEQNPLIITDIKRNSKDNMFKESVL